MSKNIAVDWGATLLMQGKHLAELKQKLPRKLELIQYPYPELKEELSAQVLQHLIG
ncbi:hypothetical protein NB643_02220 [Oxalobacter aliiformigenes]|nr:hypothetical protein [Oxalobacter aliiformigenes]WAV92896.1 hypothetical protein NB641_08900 [Oxalobacter aliiformigenes]WAV95601.1 hypothetical protein NB643_02220 [Oxalobacter aliiformigenes]